MIVRELQSRLARILDLSNQLAMSTTSESLALRLGASRSNRIGEQFWCMVGARESYSEAIRHGGWQGFKCSLGSTDVLVRDHVVEAMRSSSEKAIGVVSEVQGEEVSDASLQYIFDLLEHEAQHHGQLIRYFYANNIDFPEDFRRRYNL